MKDKIYIILDEPDPELLRQTLAKFDADGQEYEIVTPAQLKAKGIVGADLSTALTDRNSAELMCKKLLENLANEVNKINLVEPEIRLNEVVEHVAKPVVLNYLKSRPRVKTSFKHIDRHRGRR